MRSDGEKTPIAGSIRMHRPLQHPEKGGKVIENREWSDTVERKRISASSITGKRRPEAERVIVHTHTFTQMTPLNVLDREVVASNEK